MNKSHVSEALAVDDFGTSFQGFKTSGGYAIGMGTTVGGGLQGWCPNAIYIHTDGSAGGRIYRNTGTSTTATWSEVNALLDDESMIFGTGSDLYLNWNGSYLEMGPASGMWAGAPSPSDPRYFAVAHEVFDDFNRQAPLDANLMWVEVDDAGTGTNAISDAAGGYGTVVTAAADNDYHAIRSISQPFLFASGKKLWFEARFKLTEATTNESAWWFGLTDTVTTGGLQANAAGPLASYDGALVWKDEATMSIDFETSNAGTQATTSNMATFVSGTVTTVGFYFDGTATTSTITPYYNVAGGTALTAGTAQNITLSGLAEMNVIAGVKAGPSGGAETLSIDYIKCVQLR